MKSWYAEIVDIHILPQGFCTPDLSTDNQSAGTDFVDIEAGGFEDGEGLKNVSEDAESENVVGITKNNLPCEFSRPEVVHYIINIKG